MKAVVQRYLEIQKPVRPVESFLHRYAVLSAEESAVMKNLQMAALPAVMPLIRMTVLVTEVTDLVWEITGLLLKTDMAAEVCLGWEEINLEVAQVVMLNQVYHFGFI